MHLPMDVDLSIIIPTHDRPHHLARTLKALTRQADSDFDIVIVADDCSHATLQVIDQISQTATVPTKILRCVEGSAARARNRGLAAALGRNCLFLDTDIIVPRDFTRRIRVALEADTSAVLVTPVYANSASANTWPFLVAESRAIDTLDNDELIEWAALQPKLCDLRIPFANPKTRTFNHLPAAWVFCWSSALAARRSLIDQVGGFAESFENKGSEDIELGIRLSNAGATFTLLDSYAFHLPHNRDRTREESHDLAHALGILAEHTNIAVEAFCAFDCVNANPMLKILESLIPRLADLALHSADRTVQRDILRLPDPELIIGPPCSWPHSSASLKRVVFPVQGDCEDQALIIGFALPYEDRTFRVAVIDRLWQILPERLACRLFDEALRVAEHVFVIKDSALAVSEIQIPPEQLAAYDTPYWERSRKLRRSFFDFGLVPLAIDGELSSYELCVSTVISI
jgi:GT2 family glycosyltransferase